MQVLFAHNPALIHDKKTQPMFKMQTGRSVNLETGRRMAAMYSYPARPPKNKK